MVAAAQKTPTKDQVLSWARDKGKESLMLNWKPVWKDRQTGEIVNFAEIGDHDELIRTSQRFEAQYLNEIAELRRDFVLKNLESLGYEESVRIFERELCKKDPYYLGKYVLGYDKAVFHLHYFMANSMANLPPGYRGLREFPRDSYKSTFMVITYVINAIINDPNVRILLKSNKVANAGNKLIEAKNHFLRNNRFRELFPEHAPRKVAEHGSGIKWDTPAKTAPQNEGTLNAAGVGSSQTSQHYDIIIGDDFWDQKSVKSPEVMTKCRGEMAEIEYLLAAPPKGRIIFIGTRFSYDDPSTDLMKNPEYECIVVSGILPNGRSIFPEQLSLEKFYGQAHGNLMVFSCQIMLNPTSDSCGFDRAWFKYLSWTEIKEQVDKGEISVRFVVLTDCSSTAEVNSDYTAIIVVAIDSLGRVTVVDYQREKMQTYQFVERIFSVFDKWLPEFVVRQKAPLETAIMPFINEKNRKRSEQGERIVAFYDFSLGKRAKQDRMMALQPYFQQGRVYFDPDILQISELETEIIQFPNNQTNDDGMDALSEICDENVSRKPIHYKPVAPPPDQHVPTSKGQCAQEVLAKRHACRQLMSGVSKARARKRALAKEAA